MRVFAAVAVLVIAAPAQAEWSQASSEHFIIYSEAKPDEVRQFADELERFDRAVRLLRGMANLPSSHGNRLTIYEISAPRVQQLAGDRSGMIQGFYHASAAGSVAFFSRTASKSKQRIHETGSLVRKVPLWAMHDDTVLLHEYSHHLMMQDLTRPYPQWLVEGFAEFMSTAKVDGDGSVVIGAPAYHRLIGLQYGDRLPFETLLSGRYDKLSSEQQESIYGRGWLLTHYLTFEPSRKGQLISYVSALSRGVEPLQAAREAFGDLRVLEQDLEKYLGRSKVLSLKIPASSIVVAPVQVTRLTAGAAAATPLAMVLKRGVAKGTEDVLAAEARAIQARYPGDLFVETVLAEAELEAKKFGAAETASDRALAANPASTDAMILKGRAKVEQLAASHAPAASFDEARSWFLRANKIDPEDPEPLYNFYRSFARQGLAPTRNAITALHYASDLAPQDDNVRLMSAGQYLLDGKLKEARAALLPIAYNPHGEEGAARAKRMIARIDVGDHDGAIKEAGWRQSSAEPSL